MCGMNNSSRTNQQRSNFYRFLLCISSTFHSFAEGWKVNWYFLNMINTLFLGQCKLIKASHNREPIVGEGTIYIESAAVKSIIPYSIYMQARFLCRISSVVNRGHFGLLYKAPLNHTVPCYRCALFCSRTKQNLQSPILNEIWITSLN